MVGISIISGVMMYMLWLIVFGIMIFLSSSLSMLVIGCSRFIGLMWFGLRCMCI